MTRVDFYISEDPGQSGHRQLACRLIEKAYRLGKRIYVHTDDAQLSRDFDRQLWIFRDRSFVPHCRVEELGEDPPPVVIGHDHEPRDVSDLLINLGAAVPAFFSRFERVAEMVAGDEASREAGRKRYRFYQEQGCELDTHRL